MRALAAALRRRLRRWVGAAKRDELAGPRILQAFADAYPRAVFIEIGANDGVQYDHLRPFIVSLPWRGVMVEPVPRLFARLRDNYRGHGGVSFENAAISDVDGLVPFYYVAPAADQGQGDQPIWSDAIGSLSRDEVEKTIAAARAFAARGCGVHIPHVEARIERTEVPSLTFESLCRKHAIGEFDLLVIDAEGYDYEIIKGIDFERHRPRLLIYESNHLAPEELDECRTYLEGLGYELMYEGFDTWCHDPRTDDGVARGWRNARPVGQPSRLGMALHRIRTRLQTWRAST
jgi:FkbM family methyltransferase